MNDLIIFLSNYNLSVEQAGGISIVALILLGVSINKYKKKKNNTTDKTTQVTAFSINSSTTLDSVQTDEVEKFLIPRDYPPELQTTLNESVTPLNIQEDSSARGDLVEDNNSERDIPMQPAPYIPSIIDTKIKAPGDSFLEFDIGQLPPVSSDVIPTERFLQKEAKVDFSQFKDIPTLTDIVHVEHISREEFTPNVTALVAPSASTEKYHGLIDDALYFDYIGDKNKAIQTLIDACNFIENMRVHFYLKIAIQSYKNTQNYRALESIIAQFYITEKEKLDKEEKLKLKKQESSSEPKDTTVLIPNTANSLEHVKVLPEYTDVIEPEDNTQNLAKANTSFQKKDIDADEFEDDSTKEQFMQAFGDMFNLKNNTPTGPEVEHSDTTSSASLDTMEFMKPFSRPASPWKDGSVLSLTPDEKLVPFTSETETNPTARLYHVWVNWVVNEQGKTNFQNGRFSICAPWGTKSAIDDLQGQLQDKVGSSHQFSVLSVFEVKE